MAGYQTPAWTNNASPAIDATALTDLGQAAEIAEHPYGVCSTASSTAAKVVTIDYSGTLALFTGLTIQVKFSAGNNAANPTLNVNGTGAKPIMSYNTTPIAKKSWIAGSVITFVYDGTNWIQASDTSGAINLQTDLAAIHATGSSNQTGSTIPKGTYFYMNGSLVRALKDIASGASFTNGTNYVVVTAGALNELETTKVNAADIPKFYLDFFTTTVTIALDVYTKAFLYTISGNREQTSLTAISVTSTGSNTNINTLIAGSDITVALAPGKTDTVTVSRAGGGAVYMELMVIYGDVISITK